MTCSTSVSKTAHQDSMRRPKERGLATKTGREMLEYSIKCIKHWGICAFSVILYTSGNHGLHSTLAKRSKTAIPDFLSPVCCFIKTFLYYVTVSTIMSSIVPYFNLQRTHLQMLALAAFLTQQGRYTCRCCLEPKCNPSPAAQHFTPFRGHMIFTTIAEWTCCSRVRVRQVNIFTPEKPDTRYPV